MKLIEGQVFPTGYQLDKRLADHAPWEQWVCINEQTGERALVQIAPASEIPDWTSHAQAIEKAKGLVHECVNPVYSHGQENDLCYFLEPYLSEYRPYVPNSDSPWPVLSELLDVLAYIHPLGLCHGNLNPDNLLVDPDGNLKISGLGLFTSHNGEYDAYLSPQLKDGGRPDPTDDIYALGQLLFASLTGELASSPGEPGAPLPDDLRPMAEQMVSSSVIDRNLTPLIIKETLARHFEVPGENIAIADFSRAQQSGTISAQDVPVVTRQTRAINTRHAAVAFGVLAAVGIILFILLPTADPVTQETRIDQPAQVDSIASTPPSTIQTPQETGPTPFAAARLEHLQKEGESIARDILRLQLTLEDHGIFLWADARYRQLAEELDSAEALYREGSYEAAMSAYTAIRVGLEELEDEMTARLAEAVASGDAALASGDHEAALTALTIANAIEGNNPDIKAKLSRAENLEEVLSLVRRAELAERENNLAVALDLFTAARDLDPAWQPAPDGVNRITTAIKTQRFNESMSAAFQAIAARQYEAARSHFNEAQAILPDSKQPADGLAQVSQAQTNDAINEKRVAAEAFTAEENWAEAIANYEAALAISESLAFAKEGLAYATWRADLDERLTRFLSDPPLLQSNAELRAASALLREASGIQPPAVELQRRIDSLAKLISSARIKIPVTISSDGKTSITVRKQAQLGNIDRETIYLIPGRYTITGQRPGYRDVREDLVLIAGQPVPAVFVASTERVR